MTAKIVSETTRFGRTRNRCTICDKVAFIDEKAAIVAKRKIFDDRSIFMRHYKGKYPRQRGDDKGIPCGWWHLSSKRRR